MWSMQVRALWCADRANHSANPSVFRAKQLQLPSNRGQVYFRSTVTRFARFERVKRFNPLDNHFRESEKNIWVNARPNLGEIRAEALVLNELVRSSLDEDHEIRPNELLSFV